jgi:hypothetical protein
MLVSRDKVHRVGQQATVDIHHVAMTTAATAQPAGLVAPAAAVVPLMYVSMVSRWRIELLLLEQAAAVADLRAAVEPVVLVAQEL